MRIFSYILLLIITLFGVTFSTLNATPVLFNYYLGSRPISLALLLVFSFGAGILLGIIFSIFPLIKLKKDNYQLKSHLKVVEKELENLRSLPLKAE